MKSGIAGKIRKKWPQVYEDYKQWEANHGLKLGDVIYTKIAEDLIIASMITQEFYGRDKSILYVDYNAISLGFERLGVVARNLKLPIHYPLIGCGLANGKWEEVEGRIQNALDDEGVEACVWTFPRSGRINTEIINPFV